MNSPNLVLSLLFVQLSLSFLFVKGKDLNHKKIYAAISFSDTSPSNGDWNYDIRMEGTSLIDGHAVINPFSRDQSPEYQLKFSGPLVCVLYIFTYLSFCLPTY